MLTQSDTEEHKADGNTKSSARSRHWCFTINNNIVSDIDTIKVLFEKYVFQIEVGETGTKHIQGYGYFKNPRSFGSLKKKLPRAHIEICRNPQASIGYCQKLEGRLEGPWLKGFAKPLKIIDKLYKWQQDIEDLINTEADDRTIHWVVDTEGNKGKTALAKYLVTKYNALYMTGKAADCKYLISKYFEGDDERKNNLICIFDYTRSIENYVSYQGLEEIKNGIFMNTKYECEMITFNSPHIVVLANFEPDITKLSEDRWNIIRLG